MFSPLRRLAVVVSFLLALASLTPKSYAQNVTTWHNDNERTGWQQNEATLTTDSTQPGWVNQTSFGLLYQWKGVTGDVRAQPLAVTLQRSVGTCGSPCSLVFVATEQDWLYAFNATSSSSTAVWGLNLANQVPDGTGHGTAVD
jgi:hypothetical protein